MNPNISITLTTPHVTIERYSGLTGLPVYGVWSLLTPRRICTHAVKWKMARKAVDVQEATADQGASASWTRGNDCPLLKKQPI